jgi:hypothetical protein
VPDVPVKDLLKLAEDAVRLLGGRVYFSFTCTGCGERLTFDAPNTLYTRGTCTTCGTTTDITMAGFDLEYRLETTTVH